MSKLKFCKACGHPIASEDVEAQLSPMEKKVFRILKRVGQAGVGGPDIIDEIYRDREDGGPESPNVVHVFMQNIRRKLQVHGLTVVATHGPGSTYKLQAK